MPIFCFTFPLPFDTCDRNDLAVLYTLKGDQLLLQLKQFNWSTVRGYCEKPSFTGYLTS